MKLSKMQLKTLIFEELNKVLDEDVNPQFKKVGQFQKPNDDKIVRNSYEKAKADYVVAAKAFIDFHFREDGPEKQKYENVLRQIQGLQQQIIDSTEVASTAVMSTASQKDVQVVTRPYKATQSRVKTQTIGGQTVRTLPVED